MCQAIADLSRAHEVTWINKAKLILVTDCVGESKRSVFDIELIESDIELVSVRK